MIILYFVTIHKICDPTKKEYQYPLSSYQMGIWLMQFSNPTYFAYNQPMAFEVKGALNVEAMNLVLNAIADKHSILRSRYL
jgi:Condensation domain